MKEIANARAAIDRYTLGMRLENDHGLETDLWHLLDGILTLCDCEGVDFDAVLSDVRREVRNEGSLPPALQPSKDATASNPNFGLF